MPFCNVGRSKEIRINVPPLTAGAWSVHPANAVIPLHGRRIEVGAAQVEPHDTPNVNNTDPVLGGAAQLAAKFPNSTFGAPFGAQCTDPAVLTCKAAEYAIVNYLGYQIGPRDAITFRNGFFNDLQGQRTGFKTKYSENLIGWAHWIGDAITIRPEVLFERAYGAEAYDNPTYTANGGKHNQLMLAIDVIFHF